ncbi:putative Prefoldin beta-like protein [Cocos nucifera]|uniref:Putative Prefoldin beta-like protein n=1 Tax=Cocos nucifera TaxID=13894 RepID=A0A8K0MW47_COCNU|nr:putative Prefoldin beta-like protein [Cocos nucifera]
MADPGPVHVSPLSTAAAAARLNKRSERWEINKPYGFVGGPQRAPARPWNPSQRPQQTPERPVRKQYTIQLGENELVLKELELLNENANVYKLIGSVLVKQDLAETNANVRKRIEYISAELERLDGTHQDLEDRQNSKKESQPILFLDFFEGMV